MESLTPFIRHELEDAPGPSGPPEETSSVVSPPLGVEPGQPPVTEPPNPGRGSQQPPSQPEARMCSSRRRKSRSPVRAAASSIQGRSSFIQPLSLLRRQLP